MAGTMNQADLIHDLKAMLGPAAEKFEDESDADFMRHLNTAAFDFGRLRRRTKLGSVSLVSDQANYAAPVDLIGFKHPIWGVNERRSRKYWNPDWPGRLPSASLIEGAAGLEIYLDPAPTAEQIADLGSDYKFFYFAAHSVDMDATKTTIQVHDRSLLLLRAVAASLLDLAHRGVMNPVALGDGVGSMPKNGTPSSLAEAALKLFEKMAA